MWQDREGDLPLKAQSLMDAHGQDHRQAWIQCSFNTIDFELGGVQEAKEGFSRDYGGGSLERTFESGEASRIGERPGASRRQIPDLRLNREPRKIGRALWAFACDEPII